MSASIAVRLQYARALFEDPDRAGRVAEILDRPCMVALTRVSTRTKDRWARYAKKTREVVSSYLTDASCDAASFDSGRSADLTAGAEIENGTRLGPKGPTSVSAYIVVPLVDAQRDELVRSCCDLAVALEAESGAIACEPDFALGHRFVSGGRAKPRPGMDDRRRKERRVHVWNAHELGARLSGVEWGTFLGPGHLASIDLEAVRATGAFHRVVELAPHLVFLELTADPADDLSDAIAPKLESAREALASLLMDVTDVPLD